MLSLLIHWQVVELTAMKISCKENKDLGQIANLHIVTFNGTAHPMPNYLVFTTLLANMENATDFTCKLSTYVNGKLVKLT